MLELCYHQTASETHVVGPLLIDSFLQYIYLLCLTFAAFPMHQIIMKLPMTAYKSSKTLHQPQPQQCSAVTLPLPCFCPAIIGKLTWCHLLLQQIVALSIAYFVSVCALDNVTNVGAIDDLTSTARLILLLPVTLLDAVFILWVFASVSATLRTLQSRNATGKLQLYRRFTNALAVWVWVSLAWIAYEMYFKVS